MDEDQIRALFLQALDGALKAHSNLLRINASERAIAARIAQRLQPLFPGHDVETDYNRRGDVPNLQKILVLPPECQGAPGRGVAPDIIVHHPGHDEQNLLAVEIKKSINKEDRHCDRVRLAAMREQLGYRAAAFVDLATGEDFGKLKNVVEWL